MSPSSASLVDAAVAAVAVPQCGAFCIRQARACGADYKLIERRCASGRWLRGPHPILQLPGFPPNFDQRLWWALLAAGPGAVVSHWSAAALHCLTGFPPTRLTITVPHGRTHTNPVAVVYQSCAPPPFVVIRGLPVTPVARTLVDVARLVGPLRLGSAVDDADGDGKCSIPALQKEFLSLAASGRIGISTMRMVLDKRSEDAYVPPRVKLERALDRILRRIPVVFEKEAPLPGREWSRERIDRLCRAPRRLIIEGDGRRWHTRVRDFARDARRVRDALAAGYPTIRYTYEDVTADADATEVEIRGILGL